jgi:DNA-binding NarL/FixJ family response regulator
MTQENSGKIKDPAYSALTVREQQIIRFFAEGVSTNQIADNF